jgi:t-SNARE complex subunit (syntaxin)
MDGLEAKLNQIADSLLVQSQLVDRFERRTEERFANHEDRLDRIEAALEKLTDGHVRLVESHQRMIESHQSMIGSHQSLIESHQDLAARQAQTEAALQALIAQIDRFLRGQQRNGHE